MSCDRGLGFVRFLGLDFSPKSGVPDDVDCCSHCWRKMSVHQRVKTVIAVRDRQMGGAVRLIASMIEAAILEKRELP